jgi:hypothetical protein
MANLSIKSHKRYLGNRLSRSDLLGSFALSRIQRLSRKEKQSEMIRKVVVPANRSVARKKAGCFAVDLATQSDPGICLLQVVIVNKMQKGLDD